ncbi:MAG: adenylate kinase [Chloroflexota bacterium]
MDSSPPLAPGRIRRYAVVGTTGSGKSTLARAIGAALHIPCIELDALHWEPGWKETPSEILRQRVDAATRGPAWVTDGNYGMVREIIWTRAQAIVWLDYPLALILWRLWGRTWKRTLTREHLWGTNYERLWPQFFSRDSLFLWALQTYQRRKREYTALTSGSTYPHLKVFHFTSPKETKRWLSGLGQGRNQCHPG